MLFTRADDNRLQNYTTEIFTVFVRRWGEGGGDGGGVLNLSFERLRGGRGLPKLNKCEQGCRRIHILGIT